MLYKGSIDMPIPKGQSPVEHYLHKFKHGLPLSTTDKPPESREQAIAIGLSEEREKNRKRKRKGQTVQKNVDINKVAENSLNFETYFGILLKSDETMINEVDKAQIITHVPGVREFHKNKEKDQPESTFHNILVSGDISNLTKADDVAPKGRGGESVVTSRGGWQRALRSPIPGQFRRLTITADGKKKWEYYKTKSNQYRGRKPNGLGWAQVGHEDHGGYRRKIEEDEKKKKKLDKEDKDKKEKETSLQVTPGKIGDGKSNGSKDNYEYWYPTKRHAELARKYHVGQLFRAKNYNEALEHLQHLHGAISAKRQFDHEDTKKSLDEGFSVFVFSSEEE